MIKEVADVVFYEIDSKGAPSAPVLYLDTLKVSTIEQTAEVVDATGGKGNVKLISWDTNKEVDVTFEDALFSVKSLAIMFGGHATDGGAGQEVLKTLKTSDVTHTGTNKNWKMVLSGYTLYLPDTKASYFKYNGSTIQPVVTTSVTGAGTDEKNTKFDFMTFDILDCITTDVQASGTQALVNGLEIKIDNSTFGGTYYITGDERKRLLAA